MSSNPEKKIKLEDNDENSNTRSGPRKLTKSEMFVWYLHNVINLFNIIIVVVVRYCNPSSVYNCLSVCPFFTYISHFVCVSFMLLCSVVFVKMKWINASTDIFGWDFWCLVDVDYLLFFFVFSVFVLVIRGKFYLPHHIKCINKYKMFPVHRSLSQSQSHTWF